MKMKFAGGTLRVNRTSLKWNPGTGTGHHYWIYWWNWLSPKYREIGYFQDWYDGPMSRLGLWFCNITWCLPWTRHDGSRDFGYQRREASK